MIVQGQTAQVLFFLTSSTSAPAGLSGQTFTGSEIVIIKPNAATAPAANIVTVVDKGGGWYVLTLSAGETAIGLSDGQTGEMGIEINKTGALPNRALGYDVAATSPGALTAAERTAIVAALAASFAPLATAAGLTSAVAPLATSSALAGVAASIAAIPPAPSTSAIASAVLTTAVDGARTASQALAIAGSMANNATLPMSASGGPINIRNAAGNSNLMVGTIGADGARSWTTAPGIP